MAVPAMAQDNDDPDIESLSRAIRLRSSYLKGQADSLTLPAVRRLIESDLGLKPGQLDAHKALIKDLVDKVFNDAEDDIIVQEKPKKRRKKLSRVVEDVESGDTDIAKHDDDIDKKRKLVEDMDVNKEKPDEKEVMQSDSHGNSQENPIKGDKEESKKQGNDSETPVVVNMTLDKEMVAQTPNKGNTDTSKKQDKASPQVLEEEKDQQCLPVPKKGNIDKDAIKSAFLRRGDELKSQAESITVAGVRRLLEEDLGLEPHGLDEHKSFIRRLLDEHFNAQENLSTVSSEIQNETKENDLPEVPNGKMEEARDNVQGRLKKAAIGKRKVHAEEHGKTDEILEGEVSHSESEERSRGKKKRTSDGKKTMAAKKIADVKRPFSADVERLREIIKSIGLHVSPAVYRKAKQAPEPERDEVLVRELVNILSREGLSQNPSEKEIRKVKARLEKKRDLDGIESSNIVAEPRRSRAAVNSWFTPRQSKYSQMAEKEDKAGSEDSDEEAKPRVTPLMDD